MTTQETTETDAAEDPRAEHIRGKARGSVVRRQSLDVCYKAIAAARAKAKTTRDVADVELPREEAS